MEANYRQIDKIWVSSSVTMITQKHAVLPPPPPLHPPPRTIYVAAFTILYINRF